MVKNYVLDTNVLIHDPKVLFNFQDNHLILPLICIEELDGLKNKDGLVGYHAREALREINQLRGTAPLTDGIPLPEGGYLRIEPNQMDLSLLPDAFDPGKNDNRILAIIKSIQKHAQRPTILITKDLNMAIKADTMGIPVEDYQTDQINVDALYTGYTTLYLSTEEIQRIFNGGYEPELTYPPNHCFHIINRDNPANEVLGRMKQGRILPLQYSKAHAWGLRPMNREQRFAFELLMDPDIPLVTLSGGAGSGKTILATAVALQKVVEEKAYRRIIFVRPVISAGNDIGYLPGTEEEKLKPWMGPFYDAIDNLFNLGKPTDQETVASFIEIYREKGIIETKTFNYMRGRTLHDAIVIVDESQQTTPHLAKLMLTRAGGDAKFIFCGDPSDNQIDSVLVDKKSNGLVYLVDKLKDYDLTAHITLKQVERSALARVAEEAL